MWVVTREGASCWARGPFAWSISSSGRVRVCSPAARAGCCGPLPCSVAPLRQGPATVPWARWRTAKLLRRIVQARGHYYRNHLNNLPSNQTLKSWVNLHSESCISECEESERSSAKCLIWFQSWGQRGSEMWFSHYLETTWKPSWTQAPGFSRISWLTKNDYVVTITTVALNTTFSWRSQLETKPYVNCTVSKLGRVTQKLWHCPREEHPWDLAITVQCAPTNPEQQKMGGSYFCEFVLGKTG